MQPILVGQDRAVAFLASALSSGRLPHGLLFTGPRGCGRETAARGLAAGLLCERRGAPDAIPFGCGACRSCRQVAAGTHPDVHLVVTEAEGARRGLVEPDGKRKPSVEIKVDQIRELARELRLKPYAGGARVAIVVDAHRMNPNAQNALLKTLEEPSPDTCLILTAPQARAVLPTIASRCGRVAFRPLSDEDVARILSMRGAADAPARAALANGSVGAALALDPSEAAALRAKAVDLLQRWVTGTNTDRLDVAEELGRERADVDDVLAELQAAVAGAVRARLGLRALAEHDAAPLDPALGRALLEALFEARAALEANGAVQLMTESMLLGAREGPSRVPKRR